MKKVITLVAIATMSLGLGAISMAQDAGPQGGQLQGRMHAGQGGPLKVMQKLEKDVLAGLNLSDDQKKAIDDLNKKTMDELKDLRDKAKAAQGDQKHNGVQVRKVMQDRMDGMKSILTPEQYKTYREQMMLKMKEYREQRKQDKANAAGAPANGGTGKG
jgi:Spy/CpxP family protein refolding chaperone